MNNSNNSSFNSSFPVVRFAQLDVLRFLAAFMIIINHAYLGWCGWFDTPACLIEEDSKIFTVIGSWVNELIMNMGIGVDLFFLISGFLITYILLLEKENAGKINIKHFFIRRSLRIWPLYFFLIGIAPFLISWLNNPKPEYWPNILFINNFYTLTTGEWEYPFVHFWSLCIEEHFYLVWPFVIAFIPTKRLPLVFALLVLSSIIFRGYMAYINPSSAELYIFLHTVSRMDVLILGALIGYIHYKTPIVVTFPAWVRILVYCCLLAFLASYHITPKNYTIWDALFRKYIYVIVLAFGLINFLFNPKAFVSFKNRNLLHYFGKVSYGIYMYGNILLPIIITKIMPYYNIHSIYAYTVLVSVLSLIVPTLSYEIMERPFLKLKEKFATIKTKVSS